MLIPLEITIIYIHAYNAFAREVRAIIKPVRQHFLWNWRNAPPRPSSSHPSLSTSETGGNVE